MQDDSCDQEQQQVDEQVAEAIPCLEQIAHLGLALSARDSYQRTDIAGDKADVGKRNPHHQDEHERQHREVTEVCLPQFQRAAD